MRVSSPSPDSFSRVFLRTAAHGLSAADSAARHPRPSPATCRPDRRAGPAPRLHRHVTPGAHRLRRFERPTASKTRQGGETGSAPSRRAGRSNPVDERAQVCCRGSAVRLPPSGDGSDRLRRAAMFSTDRARTHGLLRRFGLPAECRRDGWQICGDGPRVYPLSSLNRGSCRRPHGQRKRRTAGYCGKGLDRDRVLRCRNRKRRLPETHLARHAQRLAAGCQNAHGSSRPQQLLGQGRAGCHDSVHCSCRESAGRRRSWQRAQTRRCPLPGALPPPSQGWTATCGTSRSSVTRLRLDKPPPSG